MNVLFITNAYLRGNNGGIYASKAYINAFAALANKMTLLYPYKSGMEPEDIMAERITMVPIQDKRSKFKKYVDLLKGHVHRYQRCALDFINSKEYDTIVFDNSVVSSGLIKRFKQAGFRTITIHHNYQIEYLKGDVNSFMLIPSLFWTFKYEKEAVINSDVNITLTEPDVELLKKHYCHKGNFFVGGIFEYVAHCNNLAKNEPQGHFYIITGWLGSKQTEQSLIPWIINYYPILKKVDPFAQLTIAGKDPSKKLAKLSNIYGINLIASPQSMLPLLNQSDYYICPTDRGGGLKLRNMDGLKCGLPVLTHSVSARGYEKMIEKGCMYVYSNPTSFETELVKMLNSHLESQKIRDIYVSQFSFNAGVERLKQIIS